MIAPPENFRYDPASQTLIWDPVPEADQYEISFKPETATEWEIVYLGSNTNCPFNHIPGTYNVHGKSRKSGEWSIYGPDYQIIV